MIKRIIVFALVAAVLVSLGPLAVTAQTDKPATTAPGSAAKPAASAPTQTAQSTPATHGSAANEIAVCGCGKVFMPDAKTAYIDYNGKKYACCSDACHKMASSDPAGAAKKADENTAKVMAQLTTAKPKTN